MKDANDPAWKDEQAARDWQTFIEKYNRAGGKDDNAAVFGYAAAIVAICLSLLVTADRFVTGAFLLVLMLVLNMAAILLRNRLQRRAA